MTPGVRVASIAACGLAGLPLGAFAAGLVVGNTVFVTAHFALGFVLGTSAERIIAEVGSSLLPILVGIGLLALLGAFGWWLLRRRRGPASSDLLATAVAWTDAACPACLAVAAFEPTER
jgi:membrane protein DedA with SNARE-associated domain